MVQIAATSSDKHDRSQFIHTQQKYGDTQMVTLDTGST